MMRHAFENEVARLIGLAECLEAGGALPPDAASVARVGAEIVRRHGELLVRLKAAMGPALVFAAQQKAEAAKEAEAGQPAPPVLSAEMSEHLMEYHDVVPVSSEPPSPPSPFPPGCAQCYGLRAKPSENFSCKHGKPLADCPLLTEQVGDEPRVRRLAVVGAKPKGA